MQPAPCTARGVAGTATPPAYCPRSWDAATCEPATNAGVSGAIALSRNMEAHDGSGRRHLQGTRIVRMRPLHAGATPFSNDPLSVAPSVATASKTRKVCPPHATAQQARCPPSRPRVKPLAWRI